MKKFLSVLLAVLAVVFAAYFINQKYDFINTAPPSTVYSEQTETEPITETQTQTQNQTQTQTQTQTQARKKKALTAEKRTVLQKVTSGKYSFRTEQLFDEHYAKHGKEFGNITQDEYLARANALIKNKNALQKTEDDGDKLFYLESSNEFAVLSSDGYIRTYFRPDSGIDYWNRQ